MHEEDIEKSTCCCTMKQIEEKMDDYGQIFDIVRLIDEERISHEKAMQMILDGECGQFNPVLLQCLVNIQDMIKDGLD